MFSMDINLTDVGDPPVNILLAGATQSGKSTFMKKLQRFHTSQLKDEFGQHTTKDGLTQAMFYNEACLKSLIQYHNFDNERACQNTIRMFKEGVDEATKRNGNYTTLGVGDEVPQPSSSESIKVNQNAEESTTQNIDTVEGICLDQNPRNTSGVITANYRKVRLIDTPGLPDFNGLSTDMWNLIQNRVSTKESSAQIDYILYMVNVSADGSKLKDRLYQNLSFLHWLVNKLRYESKSIFVNILINMQHPKPCDKKDEDELSAKEEKERETVRKHVCELGYLRKDPSFVLDEKRFYFSTDASDVQKFGVIIADIVKEVQVNRAFEITCKYKIPKGTNISMDRYEDFEKMYKSFKVYQDQMEKAEKSKRVADGAEKMQKSIVTTVKTGSSFGGKVFKLSGPGRVIVGPTGLVLTIAGGVLTGVAYIGAEGVRRWNARGEADYDAANIMHEKIAPKMGAANVMIEGNNTTPDILEEFKNANKCAICDREFKLLFRRHHCRKCKRSVCASCRPSNNLKLIEGEGNHLQVHCKECLPIKIKQNDGCNIL